MSDEFAHRLATAIEARGLPLDRVRARLGAAGVDISVAALSYWQRGVRRPERASSIQAVRELERILQLSTGDLLQALGRPRPRGRWAANNDSVPLPDLLDGYRSAAYEGLAVESNDRLRRLSVHETYSLARDGSEHEVVVRQVVQAIRPVDCVIVGWKEEHPSVEVPRLHSLSGVRLNKVQTVGEAGMLAAELGFHSRLETGDTAFFEYRLSRPKATGRPALTFDHRFTTPTKQFVLQVRFHPEAPRPQACVEYDQRDIHSPVNVRRSVQPDASGDLQLVRLNVPAGGVGVRCEW